MTLTTTKLEEPLYIKIIDIYALVNAISTKLKKLLDISSNLIYYLIAISYIDTANLISKKEKVNLW